MFDIQNEINTYRAHYANHSRSQLITETLKWVPSSAQHIAARQLLDEIDKRELDAKHEATLIAAKGANKWAKWAVIVGVLSLLVSLKDCDNVKSLVSPQKVEKIESKVQPQAQISTTKETPVPQSGKTHKEPLKAKLSEKK